MATSSPKTILAIDVGEQRIGVARAYRDAPFPAPLITLSSPETFIEDIQALCGNENAAMIVVGLPRGLDGQDTGQTQKVREFGERLAKAIDIPLYWTDEAVTSVRAESELQARHGQYDKADIDALAATYILEDFIAGNRELIRG